MIYITNVETGMGTYISRDVFQSGWDSVIHVPLNKNIFFNPTSSKHNIPFQHVNLESNFSVTITDITAIVTLTLQAQKLTREQLLH